MTFYHFFPTLIRGGLKNTSDLIIIGKTLFFFRSQLLQNLWVEPSRILSELGNLWLLVNDKDITYRYLSERIFYIRFELFFFILAKNIRSKITIKEINWREKFKICITFISRKQKKPFY